ncbi:organic cation transporter protein-like [Anneissia japonica]|uniref:organic cation transporter protein-like n=1 Tax=Anneissia japonica TaxID=1529436 RepID=UPI00142584B2|nr:organic cation transporter protein-like [Anneissia japonica]
MKFDDVLGYLGDFGVYQKRIYFMVCLIAIPCSIHQLAQVFLAAETDHWCSVAQLDGIVCPESWNLTSEQCENAKRTSMIPPKDDDSDADNDEHHCYRYKNATGESFLAGEVPSPSWPLEACHSWEYDTTQYKTTIIHEWDLVCSDKSKPALSQSIFFGGVLFGSAVFGSLADWFSNTEYVPALPNCLVLEEPALGWCYDSYNRHWTEATSDESLKLCHIWTDPGTEFVGPSRRTFAGIAIEFFWAFGYMAFAGIAYFIRKWRILAIVISVPSLVFFAYYPFIPESVRWLLSQGKVKEAERIIKKAAKVNKVTLPENIFDEKYLKQENVEDAPKRGTVIDLFRTPNMCKKTLNLLFNWFVNSMVYYGLSLSTSDLGVDDYIAFFVSGAIEIPAYVLSIFFIDYWGRRLNLCGTLVLGGVACLLTILTPIGVARTTVAMIGKFGVTASFAIVYIYSAEIYPTPVRSVGMGLSSVAARVGGILSPFILEIESLWKHLPLVIFGCSSIAAGLLALFLPETNGKQLPESLAEGENFGKENSNSKIATPLDVNIEVKSGEENPGYDKADDKV